MSQSGDSLRQMLRGKDGELGFLDKLDASAAAKLQEHLQEANRAHHRHIEDSMQEALNHFPRLLRGPIRKLFGM